MAVRRQLARRPLQEAPPGPIHYQEVLERFLASKDSLNTREIYRRSVVDFFHRLGLTDVTALDGDDIIRYNEALALLREAHERGEPGGLAPDTIRTRIYAVRSFLRFAYAYGITPHMPPERVAEFLTVPSAKELTQKDILDRDEAEALLRAAWEEPRDRSLILLMLQSGLRVSEVARLRCSDVYEAGGRYWVDVYRGKGDKQVAPSPAISPFSPLRRVASSPAYRSIVLSASMPRPRASTSRSAPTTSGTPMPTSSDCSASAWRCWRCSLATNR